MKTKLKHDLAASISTATGLGKEEIFKLLEAPKNRDFGDISFPCFSLAKTWKLSPPQCAEKLRPCLALPDGIDSVIATGPFLNFKINRQQLADTVVSEILKTQLSLHDTVLKNQSRAPVVLEYSSPNIAKPFHVGHLRATLIGNSLDRVYRKLGYRLITINHLGDWGTQFGFVWAGCELWGKPEEASVRSLVELYRRATTLKEQQAKNVVPPESLSLPDINEMARGYFIRLEKGEAEAVKFWEWCLSISLVYLKQTYQRLGVSFDHYTGESFYSDKLDAVKREISDAGILVESEGALGVELGGNLGFARIMTPDGRSLYLTRDLATAKYRAETFGFSKCLYVVGAPQSLHFQQIKGVLKALGQNYAEQIEHIAFGHVMGMKTRGEGDTIELNDFLDEAYERALAAYHEQVTKRPEGLDETEVATAVALGAIVFSSLSRTRLKDVHFSWEHALEFQGDSGPYLLYACARINGIRENALRAGISACGDFEPLLLSEESAFQLASLLDDFETVLEFTAQENEPAHLAGYGLDIAKAFSKAYSDLHVLGVEEKLASARLSLFEATRLVLEQIITLLGMAPLKRM